jgi:hypothetical protein
LSITPKGNIEDFFVLDIRWDLFGTKTLCIWGKSLSVTKKRAFVLQYIHLINYNKM